MKLIPVEPTGEVEVMAFWDGTDAKGNHIGGYGPIKRPEYPPSPGGEALRKMRVSAMISLRRAADALGMSPTELSGLERGRLTLSGSGWAEAATVIANLNLDRSTPATTEQKAAAGKGSPLGE